MDYLNNTLTMRVRAEDRASHILGRIQRRIERINEPINRMSRKLSTVPRQFNDIGTASRRAGDQMQRSFKASNRDAISLSQTLSGLLKLYLLTQGAQALITSSDSMTAARNKLNYINSQALGDTGEGGYSNATLNATNEDLNKMFTSAQKVRTSYADMMSNVSKSMTLAPDAFGGNMDNAIRFQEIMAEAYTLGGASAQEMSSSMYQMIQALGSGILAGDELRSVREGAPLAYKKIEEFAQGVYNTEESLKDLASQGKITSDIVVAAMMEAGASIDSAFAKTDMTFAQAWVMVKNAATQAFRPVFDQLNAFLNSDQGRATIEALITTIYDLANAISVVVSIATAVIGFFAQHWDRLKFVIYSVIGAILILSTVMGILAIITLISFVPVWVLWAMAAIVAIGLIIAFLDVLLGVIFWVCALIYNIVVGLVNGLIQWIWANFAEPFIGIIEWILNALNGGFEGVMGAFANMLGQAISWLISFAKIATKIIDAVTGKDLTGKLGNLQDEVLSWGKTSDAITISREVPNLMERTSMVDAYNVGAGLGGSIQNKLNGLGSKLTNIGSGSGLDLSNTGFDSTGGTLGDIASDTSDIADAVALSAEDLEYLRKIAAMEWKKEYTTANIVVDMTNNNTINGENDLDGIVTTLSQKLREELGEVANGVYV